MSRKLSGLYLITDHRLEPAVMIERVNAALGAGAGLVQLRAHGMSGRTIYRWAEELREMTAAHDALLLINDRVDVALAVEADGVHLGRRSLPPEAVRPLVGTKSVIGFSVHNREEQSTGEAADYQLISPVFATGSKPAAEPLETAGLSRLLARSRTPVFALGGIDGENVKHLAGLDLAGIAVMSAVMRAEDPAAATRRLIGALEEHLNEADR